MRVAQIDREPPGPPPTDLVHRVLGDLWQLAEDIMAVTDRLACFQLPTGQFVDFMRRPRDLMGDLSFDGDELIVCTIGRRALVLHHAGHAFDLYAPAASPDQSP